MKRSAIALLLLTFCASTPKPVSLDDYLESARATTGIPGLAAVVTAAMAEKLSGRSWESLLRDEIFARCACRQQVSAGRLPATSRSRGAKRSDPPEFPPAPIRSETR